MGLRPFQFLYKAGSSTRQLPKDVSSMALGQVWECQLFGFPPSILSQATGANRTPRQTDLSQSNPQLITPGQQQPQHHPDHLTSTRRTTRLPD